jgi:hypothetical protein
MTATKESLKALQDDVLKLARSGALPFSNISELPGIKLIPVKRLSYEQRMQRLENLARTCFDRDAEETAVLLDAWAHDSLGGPALDIAWTAFLEARQIEQDADEGRLHWSVVCEDLTCADKFAAAREIAHEDSRCALALLAGGSTATTGGRDG